MIPPMTHDEPRSTGRARPDVIRALLLFLALWALFAASRVVFVSDSLFTAWLAERMVAGQPIDLEPALAPGALVARDEPVIGVWHAVERDGRRWYGYPMLPIVLSAPGVAVLNAAGHSAVTPAQGVDQDAERRIQHAIAAPLMALLGVLFFAIARLRLPPWPALGVAVVGALGSSVYSTLSTALWSQTWSALLLGALLWHLLRATHGVAPARPWLVGLLAAGVLACRPATVSALVGAALLVLPLGHAVVLRSALAFVAALAAGVAASRWAFGHALPPSVYSPQQFAAASPLSNLAGLLFSPSRGLLVFSPWILVAIVLVLRHARPWHSAWPALCALAALGAHLALLSAFGMWWGSWSYGPRLFAEHAPWFVVLAAEAWAAWRALPRASWGTPALAALTAAFAIFVHAHGAWSLGARQWTGDLRVDESGGTEAWNWRYPQFLTGLLNAGHVPTAALRHGLPRGVYRPGTRLAADDPRDAVLFADGWNGPWDGRRWMRLPQAQVVLRVAPQRPACLRTHWRAGPAGAGLALALDDVAAGRIELGAGADGTLDVAVPADPTGLNRVLRAASLDARTPDAALVAIDVLAAERCRVGTGAPAG
jgi:hypothetical protein